VPRYPSFVYKITRVTFRPIAFAALSREPAYSLAQLGIVAPELLSGTGTPQGLTPVRSDSFQIFRFHPKFIIFLDPYLVKRRVIIVLEIFLIRNNINFWIGIIIDFKFWN